MAKLTKRNKDKLQNAIHLGKHVVKFYKSRN